MAKSKTGRAGSEQSFSQIHDKCQIIVEEGKKSSTCKERRPGLGINKEAGSFRIKHAGLGRRGKWRGVRGHQTDFQLVNADILD